MVCAELGIRGFGLESWLRSSYGVRGSKSDSCPVWVSDSLSVLPTPSFTLKVDHKFYGYSTCLQVRYFIS